MLFSFATSQRFRHNWSTVKIRDVLVDWPLDKWVADEPNPASFAGDPGQLRLLWFTSPDADGWFSLTATDRDGRAWSTFYRIQPQDAWRWLESALTSNLGAPLNVIGAIDTEQRPRTRTR
jgi:hypothetical protein